MPNKKDSDKKQTQPIKRVDAWKENVSAKEIGFFITKKPQSLTEIGRTDAATPKEMKEILKQAKQIVKEEKKKEKIRETGNTEKNTEQESKHKYVVTGDNIKLERSNSFNDKVKKDGKENKKTKEESKKEDHKHDRNNNNNNNSYKSKLSIKRSNSASDISKSRH